MRRLLVLTATLALASLACDLTVGGPTPPGSPIPVTTEAAGELANTWSEAESALPDGGDITVTLTEPQLTSYVALQLQSQPDSPLQDVQVYLRDGKVQIFGTARAGNVKTTALVVIAVSAGPDGQVVFKAERADFGPLPVPTALLDTLSATLTEAFTGTLGSSATGMHVTNLLIADGTMVISGTLSP